MAEQQSAPCGGEQQAAGIKRRFSTETVLSKNRLAIKASVRRRRHAFRSALRAGMELHDVVRTFAKVSELRALCRAAPLLIPFNFLLQNPWAFQTGEIEADSEDLAADDDGDDGALWEALDEAIDELDESEEHLGSLLHWAEACGAISCGLQTDVLCPSCGLLFLSQKDEQLLCACSFSACFSPECPTLDSFKALLEEAVDAHQAYGCTRATLFEQRASGEAGQVLFAACAECGFCAVVL